MGATGMVVAAFLHLLRVFMMGAYKYPREVTWFTGVFLFFLVIGFGFTGYLLPWDQKAYWATTVGAHMVEQVPFLGDALSKIMKGGQDLGAITLARFYAIHVLVLPILAILFIGVHLFLVVWHGISAPPERDPSSTGKEPDWKARYKARYAELKAQGKSFWPYIIFKDTTAVFIVFAIVVAVALWRGAELEDLANPTDTTYNPRPEWYFLSVFQLLKYFPGKSEAFAIVLLPTLVILALLALPFLDKGPKRHPADRKWLVAAGWMAVLGVIILTVQGARTPLTNPITQKDPLIMEGKRLFTDLHCQYCHSLNGRGGTVGPALDEVGLRRNRDWLAAHFRDPKKVTPNTKMPNFNLLDGEVEALVAYMSSLGEGLSQPRRQSFMRTIALPAISSMAWARISAPTCPISGRAGTRITSRLTSRTRSRSTRTPPCRASRTSSPPRRSRTWRTTCTNKVKNKDIWKDRGSYNEPRFTRWFRYWVKIR